MSLEKVVRPFQNNEVFTARSNPPQRQSPFAVGAVIVLTGPAPSNYLEDAAPYLFQVKQTDQEDPNQRVTERVRVENPDDADQYVIIEKIKQMTLHDDRTGVATNFKFSDK